MQTIFFGDPKAEFNGEVRSGGVSISFSSGNGIEHSMLNKEKKKVQEFVERLRGDFEKRGLTDKFYIVEYALNKAGFEI